MYVIAEVGCNHKGDVFIAEEMIKTAKNFCNVNAVKFQKREPKKCLSEEVYNSPHPVPENSYGKTYGEHRENLELNILQHSYLHEYCKNIGIDYGCSVWDMDSLANMVYLNPDFIKFPSAWNVNELALDYVYKRYTGKVHISTGMTSEEEMEFLVKYIKDNKVGEQTVIYACTSGYPVPFENLCLKEIQILKEKFPDSEVGYSGHHLGIAADIAAMTLGATYIERHFTLDRTWKGTDHAASLEPNGLRTLVRDLNNVSKALTYKFEMSEIEKAQRRKLKEC